MRQRPTHYRPRHTDSPAQQAAIGETGVSALKLLPAPQLAQAMSQLTRRLRDEPNTASILDVITTAAVAAVPAADYAGITQANGHCVDALAPTHQIVDILDEMQAKLRQGPYLIALREQHTVSIPDMGVETRWLPFTARALELGMGSMLSLYLFTCDDTAATLNLYSRDRAAFTEDDVILAGVFATHAGIAVHSAIKRQHLDQALVSRDLIGQAKGILMARGNITGDQAFDLLERVSQRTSLAVVNVARQLVTAHSRPKTASR